MTLAATTCGIRTLQILAFALIMAFAPAPAAAQETGADANGPSDLNRLSLSPRVGWQTEYDDNVFRATQPVSDMVSILSAKTDVRGRLRRVALTASTAADWVHYSKLISERGAHLKSGLKVDFLFNRITPYVSTSYDNSRERVNPEIDIRPRYEKSVVAAGGVFRLGGKTALDLSVGRSTVAFDSMATADGVNLSEALNRASNHVRLSILQDVTPVTRVVVTGDISRDQFDDASQRNSDNVRLMAGFDFDGRIKGRARGGVRVRRPQDRQLQESREFLLAVGTSATVLDRLRIGFDADRDFEPSYRPEFDYYDSYGYNATVSFAIRRSVRILASAGRRYSDYTKNRLSPFISERAGVDLETRYGTGISYRLGEFMSFDFSGTYSERMSAVSSRQFDGTSLRASVTHAF